MINVALKKAIIYDAASVFEIRNDPGVRNSSWNTDKLGFGDHVEWFKNNYHYYWMIEDDKGFIRIKDGEVSIAIKEEFRNRGIGSNALTQLCNNMDLMATIRFDNPNSIRCFVRAGFVPVGLVLKNKLDRVI